MTDYMFLLTICLFLGTLLLIFGMKYLSSALQARARLAHDNAYRDLAEKAVTAQSAGAASLSAMEAELTRLVARLSAVEKILRDVG